MSAPKNKNLFDLENREQKKSVIQRFVEDETNTVEMKYPDEETANVGTNIVRPQNESEKNIKENINESLSNIESKPENEIKSELKNELKNQDENLPQIQATETPPIQEEKPRRIFTPVSGTYDTPVDLNALILEKFARIESKIETFANLELSKLDDLDKSAENSSDRFEKLEKLDKLDKLEQLNKLESNLDKLEFLANLDFSRFEKLDYLNKLENFDVENFNKLANIDLSVLDRLKSLDKLDNLSEETINNLGNIDLSFLENLFKLDLSKFDFAGKLDKLESLENLSKLEALDKLNKLDGLEKLIENSKSLNFSEINSEIKEQENGEISPKIKEYEFFNAMEDIVCEEVEATIKNANICKCQKCFDDVCALVLNNVKPQYVTTRPGELIKKANVVLSIEKLSALSQEIFKAIELVSLTPQH